MRHLESNEMRMLSASRAASERRRQEREQLALEREETRQRELKQAQELAKEQQLRTEEQRLRAEQQEEAAARLQKSLREVEQAQRQAHARELAAFAINEVARETDPTGNLALLLAREAVRTTHAQTEEVDKMVQGTLISAIEAASPGATSGWKRSVGYLHYASFSPDGTRIVGSQQGGAMIVDASDGTKLIEFTGHEGWVNSAVFSPDGRFIVTASSDGSARLWDATTGQVVRMLIGRTAEVHSATFHPDGTKLLTAGSDGIARMWDASNGKELLQIQGAASAIFSPDGAKIVTCVKTPFSSHYVAPDQPYGVAVWDIADGQKLNELCSHNLHGRIAWLNSAALTPDGSYLVTAHIGDDSARVWEVSTGREVHHLQGHTHGVNTALFSSDGKQIVTASADGTVRVWDTLSGQVLLVLENLSGGRLGWVNSAAFSPDNRYVIVTDSGPEVHLWLVSIPYMLDVADALIHRAFTEEERQEYLHEPRGLSR
jgi:dipeptidyl aminopeptidase/acylaminoacyl peptidase